MRRDPLWAASFCVLIQIEKGFMGAICLPFLKEIHKICLRFLHETDEFFSSGGDDEKTTASTNEGGKQRRED